MKHAIITNVIRMKGLHKIALSSLILLAGGCAVHEPAPFGVLPAQSQVEWQKMEYTMFVHFGPNTFTGAEWGSGMEKAEIFNPTALDCRQWASVARAAGMKGIILTAKHHDGFCLWPNPVSSHTVAQSPWKDGKGDVLKELSEACREYGLGFGIYISPWDRNDPHYGTDEYNNVFVQTLEHALGSYGSVFEQWFDRACGEGPDGKMQVYDWPLFNSTVHRMQPDALIFSDYGPGCRWVGNESGSAGRTCWSTINVNEDFTGPELSRRDLNEGIKGGNTWAAAETERSDGRSLPMWAGCFLYIRSAPSRAPPRSVHSQGACPRPRPPGRPSPRGSFSAARRRALAPCPQAAPKSATRADVPEEAPPHRAVSPPPLPGPPPWQGGMPPGNSPAAPSRCPV